jgi:hypothetical protein
MRIRRRKGTVLPFFLRMKIHTQEIQIVAIDSLTPHPRNARLGDVVAISESIVHNGFYGAVIVQKSSGHIIVGNHRWQAAKGTGADKIPCIMIDVTDEDAERIMLADNRTAELGGFDEAQLRDVLDGLAETSLGLAGTGYRQEDIDALLAGAPDAAAAPPVNTSGERESHEFLNVVRWGKYNVAVTDEEVTALSQRFEAYVQRKGAQYGFFSELMGL